MLMSCVQSFSTEKWKASSGFFGNDGPTLKSFFYPIINNRDIAEKVDVLDQIFNEQLNGPLDSHICLVFGQHDWFLLAKCIFQSSLLDSLEGCLIAQNENLSDRIISIRSGRINTKTHLGRVSKTIIYIYLSHVTSSVLLHLTLDGIHHKLTNLTLIMIRLRLFLGFFIFFSSVYVFF